ncbi:glycoside hydrolase family 15 protein [Chamaesiphon minutus]|uniref:Glycosyl hydrolase, glucoamylase n=1 Tax=Chamaesiphon minutus (strain ATCC 27169 / PCC 6605) TaxID=1173020 RepID=K9UJK0_CHAP6|nr:glycoside hydrolase family 15 protein [Chamaesiphon minutus]AFY94818.1 glycosyl hydrolase, glucoamylase [Chamaesiphon minutus PCC 6605]
MNRSQQLDRYYQQIESIILNRQNPITGLFPASTAITAHGDYTDAWVRDNVYTILAVWGLALAYRKVDAPPGRLYELEQSVVKLMRGLLFCMLRQADKVEQFKQTQSPLDALHAKYSTHTGDIVVGDDEWGHLQLDATSLYILILAQMTASGLPVIYTLDEVNFVQNLVYYIGRTYRTPDFGLWERGDKINHGSVELNASSIGMAKAALEAINGLDLFGARGSQASVIHVLPDEIARARLTLASLLPRESSSKETDAALLSIIGFPAFAVVDPQLVNRTRTKIVEKLEGKYGCKRFLRDGHQTVLEDTTRLHYEPEELLKFEGIECEWPLFFTYLYLDALFSGDAGAIEKYRTLLAGIAVEVNDTPLLPELYYVPKQLIAAERSQPHSQARLPNENLPLVWAQSLYFLGELLFDRFLAPGDLDPLGRHLRIGNKRRRTVQIALIAEDEDLQSQLAEYGIATQVPSQIAPIQVRQSTELAAAYAQIGRNDKLGLTGRPVRRLRSLTTSRIFNICSDTIVFLPAFLDSQQFYLTFDYHFLISQIKAEIAYISEQWTQLGRPTITLLLTKSLLQEGQDEFKGQQYSSPLLELITEFQQGKCNGVPIRLGNLNQLKLTAGVERIDNVHDFKFDLTTANPVAPQRYYLAYTPDRNQPLTSNQEFLLEAETNITSLLKQLRGSENIYQQIELLHTLTKLKGLSFNTGFGGTDVKVTVSDLLDEVYFKAGNFSNRPHWAIVRYAAGLLDKVEISLSDAVTDISISGKQLTVGMAYSEAALIDRPMSHTEIIEKIDKFCREDIRDRVLTQEIIIYLGLLIKSQPTLVKGLLTLRVGYLIILLTSELAIELRIAQDEAYEKLMDLSPFEIQTRLHQVLTDYQGVGQTVFQQESLHLNQSQQQIKWTTDLIVTNDIATLEHQPDTPTIDWRYQRRKDGTIDRVDRDFYPSVWRLLEHCKGIAIGDKLEKRNRLDSAIILSEMTPGEKNFALRIEHLLNKIVAPEYRQLNIEALMALAALSERNPALKIEEYIVLDVLIGHAVRLAWLDADLTKVTSTPLDSSAFNPANYDLYKSFAWSAFYQTSPPICASYIVKSLQFLSQLAV